MTANFICPYCERNTVLEEVMFKVIVYSDIQEIVEQYGILYGEQTNEGGEVVRYQCRECFEEVAKTEDELYKLAEEKGWLTKEEK